jgi:hypothetical protein
MVGLAWYGRYPDHSEAKHMATIPEIDEHIQALWAKGDTRTREEVGGFGHLLVITQDPDTHSLMQRSLRLLMEELAPRVNDLE